MTRLSKIFILTCLLVSISGCDNEPVYAASWDEMAGYYESNYPDSSSNEKALMLAGTMERDGQKATIVKKKYEIEAIYVYDGAGRQQWPVRHVNDNNKNSLERFADTIKELEAKPKIEVETSD